MSFQSTAQAGPFVVTEPNTSVVWIAGTVRDITWNVANTDKSPVNCSKVNIYLSTDGGFTYPTLLAADVPNTGSTSIIVPSLPGNTNRVKVKAADNIFFDISNLNFSIQLASAPGIDLYIPQNTASICAPASFSVDMVVLPLLGFSSAVNLSAENLPAGVSVAFSSGVVSPADTVTVTFSIAPNAAAQNANVVIKGLSATGEMDSLVFSLSIQNQPPIQVATALPQNGAVNQSASPMFLWAPVSGASAYELQVSTSPDFAAPSIVINQTGLTTNQFTPSVSLSDFTVYYWRVRAANTCGLGSYSPLAAFQTKRVPCHTYNAGNLPINIPAFGAPLTVQSAILITDNFNIADVNVNNLSITHSRINNLDVVLNGPGSVSVDLFNGICNNNIADFNLSLDDQASTATFPCPPTTGASVRPVDSLAVFNNMSSAGIWTLSVTDNQNFNGGTLNAWSLEICEPAGNIGRPILIKNNLLSLLQWKHENITDQFLRVIDSVSGPEDLTFTLIALPVNGFVQLDSVSLPLGGTFTQEDINTGRVRYQHNGTSTTSDNFTFTVTDADGGWLGTPIFSVAITTTTPVDPEGRFNVSVYPNPASGMFRAEMEGSYRGNVVLQLFDLRGAVVLQNAIKTHAGKTESDFPVGHLANGIYFLRVIAGEQSSVQKVIIQN
ncbi:MAG: cadherin-like domain-containing protein [Bacteroidia bacterium]